MNPFQDAFIVYSCVDSQPFVYKLSDRLVRAGLAVGRDFADYASSTKTARQIEGDIVTADNIIFVISPEALKAADCLQALDLARQHHKRLLPLLHIEPESLIAADEPQRHPQRPSPGWPITPNKAPDLGYSQLPIGLSQLNWINCRDGLDDFEPAFAALLEQIQRHQPDVRQHTTWLDRALTWQRQQYAQAYLLPADTLQSAEDWLQRCLQAQSSCIPTDLHCELITESLKFANDGMTQVFLSYGEADRAIAEQVRKALLRAGLTVWIDKADIKTAEDFQKAICRGIEKADNVIYLLSPASLKSTYCQQELAYARTYHKRLIPLLVRETDLSQVPAELNTLQFIDFTQFQQPEAFAIACDQLIQALEAEALYYAQHKRLLLKALAWERQDRAKTLVLRGGEFAIAADWLAQSQRTDKPQPPTDLHRAYILASQEMNQYFDAFISYGRADSKAFAIELRDRLTAMGFRIWFDQNDIPLAVDYQDKIDEGIDKAHNFLFILSPHSVNSPYCAKEVSLALKRHKRIIPIVHVEQISKATWQQRHPGGSELAWVNYQANGLHSIFANMPPEIGKINWLYFRQEDDFEAALTDLIRLFHHDENYVQQHTDLLAKALIWERHQYQSQYLLVGEDCKAAQEWLGRRLQNKLLPCLPTDLHCEFVTASTKHAENSMAQVFLSYAETVVEAEALEAGDRSQWFSPADGASHKIYRSLIRAGFTVWNRRLDVVSGENLKTAVFRGIAEADNFVFLLSSLALRSPQCQQELRYALELNKRIIPVLARRLESAALPEALTHLQVIDLTDNQVEADYLEDENQLLKTLQQEADYHRTHKLLLVQAQKWQRQKQNPSVLLRGQDLQHYAAWLKLAKSRDRYRPTPLQIDFVTASRQQPPDLTIDVFIAYSPIDADFVRRLNDTLQVQGKSTYSERVAKTDGDTQQNWQLAVENAENFLFVLSPSSVRSADCLEQLHYAQSLNKRLIPIGYRSVFRTNLPATLKSLAQIDFQPQGRDFLTSFGELYRTLESEPEHVKTHTRLLVKAREWDQASRDDSFLLRGKDLAAALLWQQQAIGKFPQPTALQQAYLHASQELPFRKIKGRSLVMASLAATAVVLLARFVSLFQMAELAAYDHLLRQRPSEPQDDRFLLVEVDEESGSWLRSRLIEGTYQPSIGTIPDQALNDALARLSAYEPRLIGLDFYRDFPAAAVVAERLQQTDNLIGLCKLSTDTEAGVPQIDIPSIQTGFNDFVDNISIQFVRRQLLMHPLDAALCPTQTAFSLLLAQRYLAAENIPVTAEQINHPDGTYRYLPLRLGEITVPQLRFAAGPYYLDPAALNGYQTLLNFRTYQGELDQFAPKITLERLLTEPSEKVLDQMIRDRIVIIGYTDKTDRNADTWDTPYGEDVPGAVMQAQMASQLISAALDGRPLIRWWPFWGEVLWIGGWSAVGGAIFWQLVRPWRLALTSAGALVVLYGVCLGFLLGATVWVSLVPPAAAFGLSGLSVALLNARLRRI
ncbi:MAG: TIR domain-containing protein [Almyronema sp.]